MTDWYFQLKMDELDEVLTRFKCNDMTLKQWDAFHKKMHDTLNKMPQPKL
jgi:hypothetical protein